MLEIACFEITSAKTALNSVADRIEFCSELNQGGLTPNFDEFAYLKSTTEKPIFVMIRPKGGSFLYTDVEFQLMKQQLMSFKNAGANGFVFGILTEENIIDIEKNTELVQLAGDKPCTFHRAFDATPNLDISTQQLIQIGFTTILTSGGKKTALEGKDVLKKLIDTYANQINILVGSGVRSGNIAELKEVTKSKLFHSSAILEYESFANDEEIRLLKQNMS